MTAQDIKNLMTEKQIETYKAAATAWNLASFEDMIDQVRMAVGAQNGDKDDALAIIEDMFSQFGLEF